MKAPVQQKTTDDRTREAALSWSGHLSAGAAARRGGQQTGLIDGCLSPAGSKTVLLIPVLFE